MPARTSGTRFYWTGLTYSVLFEGCKEVKNRPRRKMWLDAAVSRPNSFWTYKSSAILRFVDWYIVTDVLKICSTFIFAVTLLDAEDRGATSRNIPEDQKLHSRCEKRKSCMTGFLSECTFLGQSIFTFISPGQLLFKSYLMLAVTL